MPRCGVHGAKAHGNLVAPVLELHHAHSARGKELLRYVDMHTYILTMLSVYILCNLTTKVGTDLQGSPVGSVTLY